MPSPFDLFFAFGCCPRHVKGITHYYLTPTVVTSHPSSSPSPPSLTTPCRPFPSLRSLAHYSLECYTVLRVSFFLLHPRPYPFRDSFMVVTLDLDHHSAELSGRPQYSTLALLQTSTSSLSLSHSLITSPRGRPPPCSAPCRATCSPCKTGQ